MISSVCNNGQKSARFEVVANKAQRRITIEVRAYGLGECIDRVFEANQYGEALDFYGELCKRVNGN